MWFHITRDAVREVAAGTGSLEIPRCDVGVDFYPPSGFLMLLPSPELCDRVLAFSSGLAVGLAELQLMSWTRLAGAEASKLSFKVRLFMEGEAVIQPPRLPSSMRASITATIMTAKLAVAAWQSGPETRMRSPRQWH
jgi:hypothetical protein